MCVLFVHFHRLPLIVVIYLQFGSRPTELEVQVRFSLQDNREYILDNLNIIRGVCARGGMCVCVCVLVCSFFFGGGGDFSVLMKYLHIQL